MLDLRRYPADGKRADEVRADLQALAAGEGDRASSPTQRARGAGWQPAVHVDIAVEPATSAVPRHRTEAQPTRAASAQGAELSASSPGSQTSVNPAGAGPERDGRGVVLGASAATAAASTPDHASELPARFLGLWRLASDGSASCPAQAPGATNVSDASLILVRPASVAYVESGCRVDGTRTAVSTTHPDRAEPTTVMLACEGEGMVDHPTEVWSTELRGDGDVLTILGVGRRVTTSYLRCEDGRTQSARQPTTPAVPPALPEAPGAVQDQREASAPEPDQSTPQDGEVDRCNAPRVLSVMTSSLDRFKEAARKAFRARYGPVVSRDPGLRDGTVPQGLPVRCV